MSDENLVKNLVSSSRCEVCGEFCQENEITILGHNENFWIVQVICRSCRSQSLLAAFIDEDENSSSASIEVLTDLTETEVGKFENIVNRAEFHLSTSVLFRVSTSSRETIPL